MPSTHPRWAGPLAYRGPLAKRRTRRWRLPLAGAGEQSQADAIWRRPTDLSQPGSYRLSYRPSPGTDPGVVPLPRHRLSYSVAAPQEVGGLLFASSSPTARAATTR